MRKVDSSPAVSLAQSAGGSPHEILRRAASLGIPWERIVLEEMLARYRSFEVEDRSRIHYGRGQARNIRCLPLRVR